MKWHDNVRLMTSCTNSDYQVFHLRVVTMSIYPPEQSKMNVKLLIVMKKEDKWRSSDSSFAPAFDDDFNTSHPNCLSSIWAPIPPWRTSGPNWDSPLVTDSGLWSSLGWDIAEPQRSAWCGGCGNIDRMKT